MHWLLVDFNDIDRNRVGGLARDISGSLPHRVREGERIRVHDGENEAWAVVTAARGKLVSAVMDRSTWEPAGNVISLPGSPGYWIQRNGALTGDNYRPGPIGKYVTESDEVKAPVAAGPGK